MGWVAFEEDKTFVRDALRQRGEFDYMEIMGEIEETKFFQLFLGEGVLQRLGKTYPSPRVKEEVPVWLYLASELTLRLHGSRGFGGYPYILHCGGLMHALGPDQVKIHQNRQTGDYQAVYEGFNEKNHYARITPCDKDFLRKFAKDTDAEALQQWFGTSVVQEYQNLGAFDDEGIFLVDGTYLYVPLENDRYEGATRLRFGESGHPVSKSEYEEMSAKQKEKTEWRRCYRAVTLSHTTREKDYSLRCGLRVLPGKASETPQVWPIVREFVSAVGVGVMKLLVFDRGLIDGQTVGNLKTKFDVDSLFPLKRGMDLWSDAKVLAEQDGRPWLHYDIPEPEPPTPPPDRPDVVQRREDARMRTLDEIRREEGPAPPTRKLKFIEYKYVEPSTVWETCSVGVGVLLVKSTYDNGDTLDWALASTKIFDDPLDMYLVYRIRCGIEEDHRQEKLFWDLSHFRTPRFTLVVNRVVFVELAYSLIQIFLKKIQEGELIGKSRERLLDCLLPQVSRVVLYYKQRFGFFDRYEYQEELLTLDEGPRRNALGKTRALRRGQVAPLGFPLRPE